MIGQIPSKTEYKQEPVVEIDRTSRAYIEESIKKYSTKYGVSEDIVNWVVKCESGYIFNAVGDYGQSHGLVQIHLPSHPQVSKEQAYDTDFALEFLTRNLKEGNGRMWTCYRNIPK